MDENKEPLQEEIQEEQEQSDRQPTRAQSKAEEKTARKKRMRERRLQRRIRRNARIARGRHLKNFLIWFSGVLFLPIVIVIASFLVPISVITGGNGDIVSTELSRRSMFEAVRYVTGHAGELGFADFPIIGKKLSELQAAKVGEREGGDITFGDLVYINTDKLNTIKFGSGNIGAELSSCIEVVATIESLGGASALGDFGGLSVFTTAEEAGTVAGIDTAAEGFNAKEYYYKTSDLSLSYAAESTDYKRAYNDDGTLVDALKKLSETDKSVFKLYFPPLEKVKLSELKDIIGEAIGRVTLKSLLTAFGVDNETITDILGEDTQIKGLADFDINDVKLAYVLDVPTTENGSKNKKLYDILREATGVAGDTDSEKNNNIKIGDLSAIDTDDIYLKTVLPVNTDSQRLYDILKDLTGKTETEIKVSDLSGLNTDNLHLTTVLENNATNEKIYKTLKDLTNKTDADDITVGDLTGIDTDDLHLKVLLEIDGNETLYDILLDGINPSLGVTEREDLTVGCLQSFNQDRVHLSTVISGSGNRILDTLIAKDATFGNIGESINDLEMTDVFEVECFTEDSAKAIDTASKYVYDDNAKTYTLDAGGTYYISEDAKVWLFVLYDGNGVISADTATKGSVEVYTVKSVKLYGNGGSDVSLRDRLETVSAMLVGATVRQLVQTGILTETPVGKYATLYDKSFEEILDESLAP